MGVTQAHSPAITKPKIIAPVPASPPRFLKANPFHPEKLENPFVPSLDHRTTHPVPFHLPGQELHEKHRRDLEHRTHELRKKERRMREFKARAVLSDQRVHVRF